MITHLDFHNFEFRIDENEAKDFSFFYRDGLFEFFEVGNFTKSESCKEVFFTVLRKKTAIGANLKLAQLISRLT